MHQKNIQWEDFPNNFPSELTPRKETKVRDNIKVSELYDGAIANGITADYVPTEKLEELGVLGENSILGKLEGGLRKNPTTTESKTYYDGKYDVAWENNGRKLKSIQLGRVSSREISSDWCCVRPIITLKYGVRIVRDDERSDEETEHIIYNLVED